MLALDTATAADGGVAGFWASVFASSFAAKISVRGCEGVGLTCDVEYISISSGRVAFEGRP